MNQYAPDHLSQVFDALGHVLDEIDRNLKLLNQRVAALEALVGLEDDPATR